MAGDAREPSPTAGDRAYRWVKDRILDGRLAGGQLLSEGEVADGVRVSRTPVREAFLRLESEGLLRLYPKRGALIVPVSATEITEVTEARILLECHAAEKIVDTGRAAEVAGRMAGLLDEQRALTMPDETDEFSAVDRRFHATLVAAAGNSLVDQFYAGLRDRQLRISNSALHQTPGRDQTILDEHARICELLRRGERDELRALLAAHIGATHGALLGS